MRSLIQALTVAMLGGCLGVSTSAAATTPNPCQIISSATIQAALGAAPTGKLKTERQSGANLSVCTYQQGSSKLEISIGPAIIADGGFGGPATVSKSDSSFGSDGHLAYDITAPNIYATVRFVKGAYYASVWSNTVSADKVETVATTLYKKL
jgi:hypothetical protein